MTSRKPLWTLIAALMLFVALASACGCGRTVLLPDDSPIRVGPGTTGKAYRLIEGEWRVSDRAIQYPEGWYVIPPRFVEPGELDGKK